MKESRKKLDTLMAKLFLKEPFYAGILMRLKVVESPIGTFATDGRKLIYDPKLLDEWSDEVLESVLKHEAGHVMALHPLRKGARDKHLKWNICCDAEVNHVLEKYGTNITLPDGSVPGQADLAENIYERMPDPPEIKIYFKCQCQESGGEGESGGDSDSGGQGSSEENSEGSGGQGKCTCSQNESGSGAGGWCQIKSPDLAPGEDPEEVRRQIEGIVREAATQAKMYGNMPAGLDQYLDELFSPSVDWETILRNFVEGFFEPFSDWSSPNRRYVHKGIILPGTNRRRTFADVALAVDVSGSMLGGELQQACSEVHNIINDVYGGDCELPVIWFDTDYNLEWIKAGDEMVPKGGGGTDFDAVMRCFVEEKLTQKGLIVITDGYASMAIEPEPDVPVMWAVFGDYADQFDPPFGEVVRVDLT